MSKSGRRKLLAPRGECYIRNTAGRDSFLPSTRIFKKVRRPTEVPISAQALRNNLKACSSRRKRPHKGMEVTVHHKRQRTHWQVSTAPKLKDSTFFEWISIHTNVCRWSNSCLETAWWTFSGGLYYASWPLWWR